VRQNNEDALHLDPDRGIFLVVDGIGGQAAGEKAAEIAVSRIRARLERQTGTTEQRIREAITVANNEILSAAESHPEWQGMACVLTVAVLENGSAVVGHVGDSRLYHIRRGAIRKITHDHSPVGEREDRQELTEAEAMRHPRRNEVFRDVGSQKHAPDDADFIEVQRIPFEPDSALLLCSDGLSDQVSSNDIRLAVEANAGNPEAAARELVAAANRAGGKDNVTVLVVEGEAFTAPPGNKPVEASHNIFTSRPALVVYGLLAGLAVAWLLRGWWVPPPVVITPRVLTAGAGARFASITAAMAEARAGDTVEVLGGEYREQVTLKSEVTLRSRVPREAILRAAPISAGPAVMARDIKGARFSGFRILADSEMPLSAGIVLTNSEVEVDDVEVEGAGIGVEIRGSASPVLRSDDIRNCTAEGVLIAGTSAPWISHNAFRGNRGAGLAARDGARPSLVGNVFAGNAVELPADMAMDAVRERNVFLDEPKAGHARPAAGRGGRKQ
jgi:serine/threonine protein phosphatase PrpC